MYGSSHVFGRPIRFSGRIIVRPGAPDGYPPLVAVGFPVYYHGCSDFFKFIRGDEFFRPGDPQLRWTKDIGTLVGTVRVDLVQCTMQVHVNVAELDANGQMMYRYYEERYMDPVNGYISHVELNAPFLYENGQKTLATHAVARYYRGDRRAVGLMKSNDNEYWLKDFTQPGVRLDVTCGKFACIVSWLLFVVFSDGILPCGNTRKPKCRSPEGIVTVDGEASP